MAELNELFVPENKLDAAVADANSLPTISITKVSRRWQHNPLSVGRRKGQQRKMKP